MKFDPKYSPKRTKWERFLDRFKPRSAAMRTTFLVTLVVFFSLFMSLWFFWRTLYLPEIRQHARYLAVQLDLIEKTNLTITNDPVTFNAEQWLKQQMGLEIVRNPEQFPKVRDKIIAGFFTQHIETELATRLNEDWVTVYFSFKPYPQLWIQYPSLGNAWIKEPLTTYAQYSLELIIAWLLGTPLLASGIILILVRQLNLPLKRLQYTALEFSQTGNSDPLETKHGPYEIRQVNAAFNQMMTTLAKAEEERRIMLAGISHDLRTPLTRIRLSAEMLPDEFVKEGLIYDVDDMDTILGQFISYMRDGSDEEIKPTQLNELLQEVVVQFKPLDIQFSPQDLPLIAARAMSLKRMVGNLVNNAKRYGAEPIEINAIHHDGKIRLTIRDHGQGVPQQQIEQLMQPFVRGEAARTVQGTGLGLAIVKRVVDLHHGEITVSNIETKNKLEAQDSLQANNDSEAKDVAGSGLEVHIELPIKVPETAKFSFEPETTLGRFKRRIKIWRDKI